MEQLYMNPTEEEDDQNVPNNENIHPGILSGATTVASAIPAVEALRLTSPLKAPTSAAETLPLTSPSEASTSAAETLPLTPPLEASTLGAESQPVTPSSKEFGGAKKKQVRKDRTQKSITSWDQIVTYCCLNESKLSQLEKMNYIKEKFEAMYSICLSHAKEIRTLRHERIPELEAEKAKLKKENESNLEARFRMESLCRELQKRNKILTVITFFFNTFLRQFDNFFDFNVNFLYLLDKNDNEGAFRFSFGLI